MMFTIARQAPDRSDSPKIFYVRTGELYLNLLRVLSPLRGAKTEVFMDFRMTFAEAT